MQLDFDIGPVEQRAIGGGLEGAERTSRETLLWSAPVISPDRQINPIKEDADARSRDSVQNDGLSLGALNTHKDSIVGAQYRVNAQPDWEIIGADEGWAEEFQRVVESRFNLISDSPDAWLDASRRNTFTGLVRLAVGGHMLTGEVLATAEWLRSSGRPFSTAIQMVSPSRLSNPDGMADDRYLRRGINRNLFGEALGYHIQTSHPTDFYYEATPRQWRYVEARKPWGRRQVIHIAEQMQPDQTRGISDMVAVLKNMRMTKRFREITLQNAVVNATYAAAVESELPKEIVFAQMGMGQNGFADMLGQYMEALQAYVGKANGISIDGAKMPHLFPGTKLNLKPMGTPGGVGTAFEESLLRHTAAGLGLSYEEFSRDYSKTNYSSMRGAIGQTEKFMLGRKKNVADRFASMVYALVLEEEINARNVPLPKNFSLDRFYNDAVYREAFYCCDWIGASQGQIDELKETQAALMRIKGGLSTWEIEAARLGRDWRKLFKQQARERKMQDSLNLEFALDATKEGKNDAQATMKESKQ